MSMRQDKSLHDACAKGQSRKVREILQKNTDIANRLDLRIGFLGYTPLHEAACQGHDDILQLLLIYGGNVNAMANGNYTPLHIAASMDYVKCIKVLLKNGANIKALDDFHKTPYQTAIQHNRKASATYLKSAEIIQAAGKSPPELKDLLSETSTKDITISCFDDALIEACHMGQFDAACMLLVAGAKKIKESICISIRNGHYRISALLLLCYAALSEDVIALKMLLDKSLDCDEWLQQFIDETVPIGTVIEKIRESLKNMEDYTSIAIQLPGLGTPVTVLKNLLVNTSCRIQEKKVNWSKLSLIKIDESWLVQIKSWVQYLNLSHNKLMKLPQSVVDLKMVVSLNLSKNKIKIVPVEVFSLISLRDLNLSGNTIADLPDVPQWRPILKSFNVSDNNLSSLPESIRRSCLETLNLSRNSFIRVPLSVCEIITLKNLDLSDNREINILPVEMGKLRNLIHINLKNLDQVTDPPEQIRNCAEELVTTLRTRLRNCEPYYTMKLMLVGKGGQGKTTLVHRLRDDFAFKENDLTQGVEISDLPIKRGMLYRQYIFKVWDFGGQEDYYATHQCFLSTMSLYLLVWRLIDGEEGVQNLTPWLDNIAVRSPGSTVIVVGTHLDCITAEKHGTDYVTRMNERVRELVEKSRYKEKLIVPPNGICAVSCAFGASRPEIYNLRLLIYDTATNLKKGRMHVMGELIPNSFFSLIERIEKRRDEVQKGQLPIIRKEEFDAMVKENSLHCGKDIQEPMDVRDATVFLRERGVIMHFDDPNEGLSDLYFIEPRWLCKLMARVITIRGHADLVKDGVLQIQETKTLFHSEDIPFDFYDQYIRLLVRFQIAYLLDASRVLVPSKLPEKEPEHVTKMQLPYAPVRRVYKIDYQRIHGFWPRFMSRFFFYVKEMIAVDATRYQKSKGSEYGYFGHFCLSCLRVDASSAGRFSCFLDPAQWESRNNTEGSRRTSRGTFDEDSTSSSTSKNSATSQDTSKDIKSNPSRKDPSRNNTLRKDPTRKDSSRKDPSRKDSSRKDPSRNEPTRKNPSKKEPSKKKSTKREPSKNGTSVKIHSRTVNGPSQANAFPINVSMPASAMPVDGSSGGNDDFHRLLLDPSVKLFSDDELQDDTDGQDRIVINNVDTGMNYSRKSESFHDKKNQSIRRVAMDLRIPSFDASQYDHGNRLRGLPRQKSTTSSGEEENTENQRNGSSGGEESSNNLPGKVNSDYQKDSDDAPSVTEDVPSTSEDVASVLEVNPNASEDVPGKTESVPNVTEDFVVENGENATKSDYNEAHPDGNEAHPDGNEDHPNGNERTTSDRNNSEKVAAGSNITGQVIIIKEDVLADGENVSESEETKTVGIKIPSSGLNESRGSDENMSCLSCSDVCSLSSWKNSKGLPPSAAISSVSPENTSFSETYNENMSESFDDSNAHLVTASVSSDGHEFGMTSASCDGYTRQQREVAIEEETSYERSRNSMSQSVSTASSVRSGELTDTDCEILTESMSSISTTNDYELMTVTDHHPEEYSGIQFEQSGSLDSETNPVAQGKVGQTRVGQEQFSRVNSNSLPCNDNAVIPSRFSSKENFSNYPEETDVYNSDDANKLNDRKDCKIEIFTNDNCNYGSDEGIRSKPGEVNDNPACDVINDGSDVTDAGQKLQQTLEDEATINEAKSEMQSDDIAEKLKHGLIRPVYHSFVPLSPSSITSHPGESIDTTSSSIATNSASVVNDSRPFPSPSMYAETSPAGSLQTVGATSENVGVTSESPSRPPKTAGKQSETVGEEPDSDDSEPEPVDTQSETPVVETKKCTLCKENIMADQLVTIPVDVADLIEKKIVHCWRTGVCVAHPEVFLVVAYRELSDSIVVEIAVSPNALGRRLLIFVVDHLDTLIKEWYPGLLMTYSSEPTVQKFIPCRNCEKDGKRRPVMFTFDSCVTQYSMGNFVKCFEHEVSIQDIAPDVVLQDIDADLLLKEEELHYERSDVNLIGKGKCGNVYRGRCRERDAAIKEYSKTTSAEGAMERYSEVRNEVNVLRRLGQHPFLVNVIGVCLRPFRLVLELAMEGSLAKTLFNPLFLIDRIVVYRMLHQVADAISFLHSMDVIYRDLKPQNVLVMSYEERHDVNIKLTDFGTAAFQFNEGLFAIEGTVGYYAPEMLKEFCKRTGYDAKVDVFSLGMLVYSFITRRQPFFNINSPAEVNNMAILGRRPEYDDITQARIGLAGLTWLMDNCLSYEPTARHCCTAVAEQLRSTSFQLLMGIMALPCQQSVRHVGLVQVTLELWVTVDDKAETTVFIYDMKNWCLKKSFAIKIPRSSVGEGVLVLQVNCMHVMAAEVLIGLRGDLDLVAIFDAKSYQLKAKITNLEEPVFSLSSSDSFIFLGMSSGICLVTSRTKIVQSVEISHSEPVTCVTTVGNDCLWLTAGKCIQIFQVESLDKTPTIDLHAVRFSSSSAPFSQTVLSVDGSNIWCVSKGDSIITAWNVNTRQKTLEIDCKSILGRSLSEDGVCDLLESAVTCVLPVLDTVWIGTGGGKLLIVDVTSSELITSLKLFDDHVRTLTLVPGPGPCGTEKYYVVVSGRKVLETALSRADQGKHVCRLNNDVIKPAPHMRVTPVKDIDRSKNQSRRSPFRRSTTPQSGAANSDGQDHGLNYARGSVLMFFEALPSKVLQRTESK